MSINPAFSHGGGGGGGYAKIVGTYSQEVQLPGGNPHARMDLAVPNANGQTDSYEADVNTKSTDGSNVMFLVKDSTVNSLPALGAYPSARFSYSQAGLKKEDFQSIGSDDLHKDIIGWASSSNVVEMNGMTYKNGPGKSGIHDVHYNNGEEPGSGHANNPNEDGYCAFYTKNADGTYNKKEVFTMFDTQTL